jgi:hypothetical protein
MRAMMIAAAAALGMASSAAAEEAPACYDGAVTGWMINYANDRLIDDTPVPADRILPRVQTDVLIQTWSTAAGPNLPKAFWARGTLTEMPRPSPMLMIYLKSQPDGVPAIVGYRTVPAFNPPVQIFDYPAC